MTRGSLSMQKSLHILTQENLRDALEKNRVEHAEKYAGILATLATLSAIGLGPEITAPGPTPAVQLLTLMLEIVDGSVRAKVPDGSGEGAKEQVGAAWMLLTDAFKAVTLAGAVTVNNVARVVDSHAGKLYEMGWRRVLIREQQADGTWSERVDSLARGVNNPRFFKPSE